MTTGRINQVAFIIDAGIAHKPITPEEGWDQDASTTIVRVKRERLVWDKEAEDPPHQHNVPHPRERECPHGP